MSIALSILRRPPTTAIRLVPILSRTMASSQYQSVSDAVKHDHREIYEFYDKYVESRGNKDAQERWANQLRWEIARHSIGEELVLYPLMEEKLGTKGVELANQDRADHMGVKERLYRLESLKPGAEEHSSLLKETIDHLREHAESEEANDLPLLEKALSREDSAILARKFTRTKKFVPTHSHPSAPDKPPFETLAGLMAAPLDKLKDAFNKFPTDDMKQELKT